MRPVEAPSHVRWVAGIGLPLARDRDGHGEPILPGSLKTKGSTGTVLPLPALPHAVGVSGDEWN